MDTILSNMTVSVSELKNNFAKIIEQADDQPVAVLYHDRPEAYLLPAEHYERLMEHIEDLEDARLVRERMDGSFVEVDLDEL